jgi:hypothetical protein
MRSFRRSGPASFHYREGSSYGNPFLRLLRREVEALGNEKHGAANLNDWQAKTELARTNRELRGLKAQVAKLEQRKSELKAVVGE